MQYLDITSCSEGHAENMHVQDMPWHDCWPLTRSNTTREREREFWKPEGNTMNPTEAATDSCWSVCHSLRSMACSLTVSIWTAHCTSTHQVSRRGCARQLLHVPLGRAPPPPRAGTGQATHLPITRAPRLHLQ